MINNDLEQHLIISKRKLNIITRKYEIILFVSIFINAKFQPHGQTVFNIIKEEARSRYC